MSLLGLDRLAAMRRAERQATPAAATGGEGGADEPQHLAAPPAKRPRLAGPAPAAPAAATRPPSPVHDCPEGRRQHGWQESEWEGREDAMLWYEGPDEFGGASGDLAVLEGGLLESTLSRKRLQEREIEMAKSMQGRVRTFRNLRQEERQKESDRWEENRMVASGAMAAAEADAGGDDMDEGMVRLHVTRPRPPFLEGDVVFSKRQELVLPVKDVTCDMYENAKKGSALLRFVREQRERERACRDALDASGSMLDVVDKGEDVRAMEREERRRVRREQQQRSREENDRIAAAEARRSAQFGPSSRSAPQTPEQRERLQLQRQSLPVYQSRTDLLRFVRENQIVVLIGDTGSGKTTQVAQYLYESGYCNPGGKGAEKKMVGCTQPRRVAAMSVAKRVSEEVGTALGEKVGYAIRFEDCTSEHTLIKFMTDGVLLREAMTDPELTQYSCVIMDEAHERSLNTDVLFGVMKGVVGRRRDLKLIVTSATMDQDKFSSFFCNCPVFRIPGRCFPVETFYKDTTVGDYVDAAVKQAVQIHLTCGPGDILIFMTGQEDIECSAEWIRKKLKDTGEEFADSLLVLPIYSLLPSELQAKIFEPAPEGQRKCIIATNIAETSLTVDGVFYVIDSGFAKLKLFNPKTGMDALQVFPASQAAAKQRAGRAGRTGPGKCFRLYTEYQFNNEMMTMTVPEMQRTNLCNVVLLLKSLGIGNLLHFEFMDPPPQGNLVNSMYQLWMLGALDDAGDLTPDGVDMIEFPVDPPMAKALLYSAQDDLHCAEEVLTVVACLSSQSNVFLRPRAQEALADQAKEKFMVAESDHLTLLNAFQMYRMNGRSARWCQENFLNHKALRRVEEVRVQLRDIMIKKHKRVESCGLETDSVKLALAAGYFHNAGKRKGMSDYYSMLTGVPCFVHPSSSLYNGGTMPDYVIYHEMIYTQKEYMNTVSAVEAAWMQRVAPTFFRVHERRFGKPAPTQTAFKPRARPEAKSGTRPRPAGPAASAGGSGMSNLQQIEQVLKSSKPAGQAICEVGSGPTRRVAALRAAGGGASSPPPGWTEGGLAGSAPPRRATPGLTPRLQARPGTPGYRRRAL
eukprot:TRINITY_DN56393_c0_g1_i1.p1 TRINITY_DN56393_c0_g1~~TRINITY_DN56393_c0_g1_i1.p1  ORF type:complete len:1082 (+),score=324.40 TRINITY_DN56393_c0_g1_i1:79-3324(+)